ncbi:MAG TPA: MBL fold metallo-hydrolase [Candidatus Deferrimicrobiaceae bacterium]
MTDGSPAWRIHVLPVGPLQENCAIVEHVASRTAAVVDPGDEGDAILGFLSERELTLPVILVTHGHFDHVGAIGVLKARTGAKVHAHAADAELMKQAARHGALYGIQVEPVPPPDVLVGDGDTIPFGEGAFEVRHTPGHSAGSVTYVLGGWAFVGDLIFAGSIGRTDLAGGSMPALLRSVREKIFTLEDDVVLVPGHGPDTTVGREKRSNPFFEGDRRG